MGYTIKIGNASPHFDKSDFPYLSAHWKVEHCTNESAPCPPGDEDYVGHGNSRSPSYTAWAEFSRATFLEDLFFNKHTGLMDDHPGCVGITIYDVEEVKNSLAKYKNAATLPAGSDPGYDPNLARLEWLAFWMDWAVSNCETPAIENS